MQDHLARQKEMVVGISASVKETLTRVQESADAQRLTQDQITALVGAFQEMPSPAKSVVLNVLSNIVAAPWAAILMELLK